MFAGRYEIINELGRGGYGVVHRSFDQNLGREVALKVFHPGAHEVLAVKEARILTQLEGDHILRVFNAGAHQDVPYLVTAIAAERSTEDHVRNVPGIRADLVIRWIRHLLVGLRVTHTAGLLHRDITPSNLFLDSFDHARLGDFGVANQFDPDGTAERAGNPYIQSPEAILHGRISIGSEIWAVGVTAWRLLTGKWPFTGTAAELADAITQDRRPRLRDVAPHIPRNLARVVEKALEFNPADRYASAPAMDEALSRLPAFNRIWTELPAPYPHRAWQGVSPSGTATIRVETERLGDRWRIETRYEATGRRIVQHCDEVTSSRLPVRLRSVFSGL